MTDTNLFERIEKGEKKAFDELFLSFYKDLCRFALVFIHDKDSSEEVVQRVFVRIWEQRAHLIQPDNIKSYLFKSAYNECLKSARTQSTRKKHLQNYLHFMNSSSGEDNQEIDQIIPYLNQAISNLPEKCRQIFVLHKVEGMKQKEVAGVLNISVKTVENQVAIAVSKLRTELKPVIHLLPEGLLFLIYMNN